MRRTQLFSPGLFLFVLCLTGAAVALAADVTIDGTFVSNAPEGTPPLSVDSKTQVPNLNADLLDGLDAVDFAAVAHDHDVQYFTKTELSTAGSGAQVHWDNLIGVPNDGVVEINQGCALAGCFDGDDAGFPITILLPGSYRLTSNLDISGEPDAPNLNVIHIFSGDVTLDLGGFTLIGPTSCTGSPLSCSPIGSGIGIEARGSSTLLVKIRNGVVRGMGQTGVRCDRTCEVEGLRATENGVLGLSSSNGSATLRDSIAFRNGGDGIFWNGSVTGSIAQGNAGYGIFLNPMASAIGNTVIENAGNAIRCAACLLLDNRIDASAGGFGLELNRAAYGSNIIFDDNGEFIAGTGVEVAPNACVTNSTATPCS